MSEEASLSKKNVGRAAIWATLGHASGQLLSLLTFLFLARLIEPSEFGAVAIALTLVEISKQIGLDPPAMAVLSKEKPTERDYNTCFVIILGFSIVVALGLFFFADAFADWLGRPRVADAIEPIALVLLLLGLSRTHEAWLTRRMMFRAILIRTLAAATLGGLVGIILALQGYGLWALVGQQLVYGGVSMAAYWFFTRWRPSLETSGGELSTMARFALPLGVAGAFNALGRQGDVVVSGYYLGLERTGIYNGAKRLNLAMILMLNAAFNQIALPSLARMSSDPDQMRAAVLKAFGLGAFVAAPAYFGISAVAPDLVAVLFGPAWSDVAPILAILSIAGVFVALEEIVGAIFLSNNRPKWWMYFNCLNASANLLVVILAAPYGLEALATAYAVRVAVFFPIAFCFALALTNTPLLDGARVVGGAVLSAAAMAGTVMLLASALEALPALARLPLLIIAGGGLYIGFSAVFNRKMLAECLDVARQIASRRNAPETPSEPA